MWEDVCHYIYEEDAFDNIVISHGPGSLTCPVDIGICLRLLFECKNIPILGVCLGHQERKVNVKQEAIESENAKYQRVNVAEVVDYHSLRAAPCNGRKGSNKSMVSRHVKAESHESYADAESLPKELIPIAWTSSTDTLSFLENEKLDFTLEACESLFSLQTSVSSISKKFKNRNSWPSSYDEETHGSKILMDIMHSRRPHYGLQFHPESVATCHGRQIFKNFREIIEDYWGKLRSERKVHYAGA